jgi:hypothetical protein
VLVEVQDEDVTEQFGGEPPDGRHVGEGTGDLLCQGCAFTLKLLDSALGVLNDLGELSFGGLNLVLEVGKGRIAFVKETAGAGERGCCGWFACKLLEGHGGKMGGG